MEICKLLFLNDFHRHKHIVLLRLYQHLVYLLLEVTCCLPSSNTAHFQQGILTEGERSVWSTFLYIIVQISSFLNWKQYLLFSKSCYLNWEVNCTEPSPSVRLPCFQNNFVTFQATRMGGSNLQSRSSKQNPKLQISIGIKNV